MNCFIIYKQTFDFSPLPKPCKNLPHIVVYMRQMFFFVTFEHVFNMVRLQKCQLYHEQKYKTTLIGSFLLPYFSIFSNLYKNSTLLSASLYFLVVFIVVL